jgi:8-oxo-dGTP diphosphatase
MRRLGETPRKGLRYRDRPGAYGVLLREGHVLLAAQDGALLLPGGGVDPGETPARALRREVLEETGWRIGPPRRLTVFARHCWLVEERYWARKIQHVYLARPARRIGPPMEPDHVPVWMRAADAPDRLAVEGEAAVLEQALRALERPGTRRD